VIVRQGSEVLLVSDPALAHRAAAMPVCGSGERWSFRNRGRSGVAYRQEDHTTCRIHGPCSRHSARRKHPRNDPPRSHAPSFTGALDQLEAFEVAEIEACEASKSDGSDAAEGRRTGRHRRARKHRHQHGSDDVRARRLERETCWRHRASCHLDTRGSPTNVENDGFSLVFSDLPGCIAASRMERSPPKRTNSFPLVGSSPAEVHRN
jgi:hypothetical protein